jgi:predicted component of type VI protein secretion system
MGRIADTGRWLVIVGLTLGVVAMAQSLQQPTQPQKNQGGCYDTDANDKEVFVPNCGLPAAPEYKHATPPNAAVPGTTNDPVPNDPAKQFPFPGQQAPTQAPGVQQPTAAQTGTTPATVTDPSKAFPFPGEENTPLVRPDGQVVPPPTPGQSPGGLKDAGSSGDSSSDSSSSSSSSSSSGLSGLPDDSTTKGPLADDPDAVLKKPRRKVPAVKEKTPSEREEEDLSVAEFYMNDNNFRGAYTRAVDAVATVADDPNAHFALAEAARKLGKLDEAMTEYKKTLTLDPVPKQKKAAEKALKEMAGG